MMLDKLVKQGDQQVYFVRRQLCADILDDVVPGVAVRSRNASAFRREHDIADASVSVRRFFVDTVGIDEARDKLRYRGFRYLHDIRKLRRREPFVTVDELQIPYLTRCEAVPVVLAAACFSRFLIHIDESAVQSEQLLFIIFHRSPRKQA